MAKNNDELIHDFMNFKSAFHHIYVMNGLYIYSKLLLSEVELPEMYAKPFGVSKGEWKQCAEDFIQEMEARNKELNL